MTETDHSSPELSGTLGSLPAIPKELSALEAALVARRRAAAGLAGEKGPEVGLALSGGGIRSATFSLGVIQALARHGLLRRFDWLSTVSGGGYAGSFLGRLYTRSKEDLIGALPRLLQPAADTKLSTTDLVERILAEPRSKPVSFLRENGRYLSPNGAGDLLLAGAVAVRNTVSIHVVLGALLVSLFLLLEALGILRGDGLLHAALASALAAVLFGILYWAGQPFFRPGRDPFPARRFNNLLSRATLFFILVALVLLVFSGIGALAGVSYRKLGGPQLSPGNALSGVFGAGGLFAAVRALFKKLPTGEERSRIPVEVIAAAGALVLSVFLVTFWAVVSVVISERSGASTWVAFVAAFALTLLLGQTAPFLNQSSLQAIYGARLSRAYLGASNPERWKGRGQNVTEPIEGDGAGLGLYRPHEAGGPLHLVNVTLNETIAGKSQVEQRDRKGLAMAVGPVAVSAGKRAHALREKEENGRMALRPLETSKSDYAIFTPPEGDRLSSESLPIETWVAISGAAFSTGLGSRTNLGLSLLCGFFNIRLGYWWDSGIEPRARAARTPPSPAGRLQLLFDRVLPVQSHLLEEILARFRGPNSRRWYLSDGGHFENTACYELIRRRVPVIVLCDDGADPDEKFGDLANLVRKARIDFRTEITVLAEEDLADEPAGRFFGALGDLRRDPSSGFARKHAALARLAYPDGTEGVLVVLKPSLTGDEPLDLLEYRAEHKAFPQEPTSDQFFDEAQWESYRKLGEVIGNRFAVALEGRPLAPETFLPGARLPRRTA